ncbi:hypothetical protein, partial [Vibrio parahaemolyticus]|uniref:hypothetical protein n=1 Tax=Vibrio parahaemolyticus TaxID=670 RepID=UPI001BB087D5
LLNELVEPLRLEITSQTVLGQVKIFHVFSVRTLRKVIVSNAEINGYFWPHIPMGKQMKTPLM